jgi:uncharacterized protein (DUF849 family)
VTRVRLQACLDGARRPQDVPGLPVTPEQLARAAAEAVEAGADGVHLHPKDPDGADSLEPSDVEAAVAAVRAAVPGVEVGVTTGLWAAPDAGTRERLVRAWAGLAARPDVASVNWHEEGGTRLAELLLVAGIGVEAGIWTTEAAHAFAADPLRSRVTRVLVESTADDPETAVREAAAMTAVVDDGSALLVHGENGGAWPVLAWSAERRYAVRVGLEDVLALPGGAPVTSNAALVAAAVPLLGRQGPGAITADGCPVEVYRRLPEEGEAAVVHAAVPAGAAVLDLGAGVGRIAHPLAALGHRVVAVDDSPDMLALIRPPVVPVLSGIEDLRLAERFGGVLLASHLVSRPGARHRRRLLAAAAAHLVADGVLVAQWHAPEWFARLEPGGRYPGSLGEVGSELHVLDVDERRARAVVRYSVGADTWEQAFTTARLGVDDLDEDLASVGLGRRDWLTPDRSWFSAGRR